MKQFSATLSSPRRFFRQLAFVGLLFPFALAAALAGSFSWSVTGFMISPRWGHTGTSLADGRVLAAGGYGHGVNYVTKSAEVYDPASGSWALTGEMSTSRAFHAAARLQDGTVLIAGGFNSQSVDLSSAERYDPATGQFSDAGNMMTPRVNFTATLLPDGRVLAVGGDASTTSTTAELYNPATNSWSSTDGFTPKVFNSSTRPAPERTSLSRLRVNFSFPVHHRTG